MIFYYLQKFQVKTGTSTLSLIDICSFVTLYVPVEGDTLRNRESHCEDTINSTADALNYLKLLIQGLQCVIQF